jgi:hypothetical protein
LNLNLLKGGEKKTANVLFFHFSTVAGHSIRKEDQPMSRQERNEAAFAKGQADRASDTSTGVAMHGVERTIEAALGIGQSEEEKSYEAGYNSKKDE